MEHFDKQNIERCIKRLSDLIYEATNIQEVLDEMKDRDECKEDIVHLKLSADYLDDVITKSGKSFNELKEIFK